MGIFGRVSFWLAVVAVAAIAVAVGLAMRWTTLANVYHVDLAQPPKVTAQHVAALRKLRFAWAPLVEGGGPMVDPVAPYGSRSLVDDLGPILGTRDAVAVARFHMEVSAILLAALRTAPLEAGDYRLHNLDQQAMEAGLRSRLAGLPAARVDAVVADMPQLGAGNTFQLTGDHIALLRHLAFEMPEVPWYETVFGGNPPVPEVDFKRPFGDSTDFAYDMAAILGWTGATSDAQLARLDRLYWEMWPALQAFVENADFSATASAGMGGT